MSKRYNIFEEYGEKFFQVPKVFDTNPKYAKMTASDKLGFGYLKDRFELSKKNKWFDEKGEIYFIFTIENLMEVFKCAKATAVKIKKTLVELELLEVKKRGQGKPDILYLNKPEVTEKDVYKIMYEEEERPQEEMKKEAETLEALEKSKKWTSRGAKNKPLEVQKIAPNDTDFKETEIKETEKDLKPKTLNLEQKISELRLPNILIDNLQAFRSKVEGLNFNIYDLERFYLQSRMVKDYAESHEPFLNQYDMDRMLKYIFREEIEIQKTTYGLLKNLSNAFLYNKFNNQEIITEDGDYDEYLAFNIINNK